MEKVDDDNVGGNQQLIRSNWDETEEVLVDSHLLNRNYKTTADCISCNLMLRRQQNGMKTGVQC